MHIALASWLWYEPNTLLLDYSIRVFDQYFRVYISKWSPLNAASIGTKYALIQFK